VLELASIHTELPLGDGVLSTGCCQVVAALADIVVGNCSSTTIGVYLAKGDGTLAAEVTFPGGAGPRQTAAGDFNGDVLLDIAAPDLSASTLDVLLSTTK
jgi:hypothetical protein